jgi:hypothetical protein
LTQSHTQRLVLGTVSTFDFVYDLTPHTLYNSVNRAALLAKTTVNALGHVDVVARSPSATIHTLLGFNCDSLRRTDSFAQLARNTALLSCWVTSKSVLASEAG